MVTPHSRSVRLRSHQTCSLKQDFKVFCCCVFFFFFNLNLCVMEPTVRPRPHSVKRWQLNGTDYEPQQVLHGLRFSSWTPLHNTTANLQLFEERVNLVLHWFDLWTDQQRKHLLHSLLSRCSRPQLKFCRDLLMDTVPVSRLDFTAVLPRFLSLYVMSFLSPRDLSRAAQVSWNWRVLSEQDCIWASRCIKRGWFLPYSPAEKEFGAWKNHYVSCVSTLDYLTPREAAKMYGTLIQSSVGTEEKQEQRRKERITRERIKEKLQEEKRMSLRSRRAWGSRSMPEGLRGGGVKSWTLSPGTERASLPSWYSQTFDSSSFSSLSQDRGRPITSDQCRDSCLWLHPSVMSVCLAGE
ncbi:epithelial cell-transforming sequence 2 oncogene-like isoform X2 [Gouania willdenowi]|uniref:epithelial cell-transforming sequence 2 oncogene-like isoform X2 n=1 Tax=Gouania willdenowi TaxID=441366 RepID=UPI00105591CF|nr:epithelial cell-transforming sequence 2 oncogene-like isoform X2 [Gouania willdenowi]